MQREKGNSGENLAWIRDDAPGLYASRDGCSCCGLQLPPYLNADILICCVICGLHGARVPPHVHHDVGDAQLCHLQPNCQDLPCKPAGLIDTSKASAGPDLVR